MKKLLFMVFALVFAFALTGCSLLGGPKPNLDDLEGYEDIFDEEDFYVGYTDDKDVLDPYMLQRVVVYSLDEDSDEYLMVIEFADAKSAKLYYNIAKLENDQERDNLEAEVKYLEAEIKAYTYLLEEYGSDYEKEEREYLEEYLDDLEEELKEVNEEIEELENVTCGRKGNFVWMGSVSLIEQTK